MIFYSLKQCSHKSKRKLRNQNHCRRTSKSLQLCLRKITSEDSSRNRKGFERLSVEQDSHSPETIITYRVFLAEIDYVSCFVIALLPLERTTDVGQQPLARRQ